MRKFNLYAHDNKAVQDAYDMLTVNIHILNSRQNLKTFVLTSCNPGEGKTTLAISLAISMAGAGWKVLLVDADMRKPKSAKRLNEGFPFGLSDYLTGNKEYNEVIDETNIPKLKYLSCGSFSLNQVELLCSARFEELLAQIGSEYDFVIFDAPAIETVADATIIAAKVDATLLVVKMGSTKLSSLKRAKQKLEDLNANVLGSVINKVAKNEYKTYIGSYDYFFNEKRFLKNKRKKKNDSPSKDKGISSSDIPIGM